MLNQVGYSPLHHCVGVIAISIQMIAGQGQSIRMEACQCNGHQLAATEDDSMVPSALMHSIAVRICLIPLPARSLGRPVSPRRRRAAIRMINLAPAVLDLGCKVTRFNSLTVLFPFVVVQTIVLIVPIVSQRVSRFFPPLLPLKSFVYLRLVLSTPSMSSNRSTLSLL